MRTLLHLSHCRVRQSDWPDDLFQGAFALQGPCGAALLVLATTGGGWDHVSVSLRNRCPNWQEMEFVKRLFFREQETAMQLHVPPDDHISFHPYCLHLWRPNDGREIPRPPPEMVGPKMAAAGGVG
ncbi:MAG: hypothetical protein KGH75_00845 [Rhodospirillales bacterium]|nr:hypothetical protein [Rhodospirillales bacterium]